MITFDKWFDELVSNYVWAQPAQMHHKPETFRSVANKVYMQYVAQEIFPPIQEARKHVYNKLILIPGDSRKPDWRAAEQKVAAEVKEKEWQPVSPEKRAEYLEKLQAIIKGSTMMSAVPRETRMQQVAEAEGQWLPKKPAPYPMTSAEEAYVRQRHLEYIKSNYEPRSGHPLASWVPESEWNIKYDNENL